jgi:uncharacterized DUF497 family protein
MLSHQEAASCSRRRVAELYIRSYTTIVRFAWDAAKSEANLRERGFDFETDRRIGRSAIERRIISARRASRKERDAYEAAIQAQSA